MRPVALAAPIIQPEQAQADLDRLLHALPRLQVTTLDGFLQRCVRSLQNELGLSRIEALDAENSPALADAERQALEASLEELAGDDEEQLLHHILIGLGQGTTARSNMATIRKTIAQRHRAYMEQPDPQAWDIGEPPWPALEDDDLEQAIASFANAEQDDYLPRTKAGKVSAQFKKAWQKDLDAIKQGDFDALIMSGLAQRIADGVDNYYRMEIPAELCDCYHPLIAHATALLWGRLALLGKAAWTVLQCYDRHLNIARRQHGVLAFSDLPRLLQQAPEGMQLNEELAFRLDGQVSHMLLDEFQDTSREQWSAINPLVDELLAHNDGTAERSCCIVGDTKQAIYSWRGGCSAIMSGLGEHPGLPEDIAQEVLDTNYRSSDIILQCTNTIFADIANNPVMNDEPVFKQSAENFQNFFTTHHAGRDLPGCVHLHALLANDQQVDHAENEEIAEIPVDISYIAERIAALRAEHPQRSIAVLYRNRDASYRHLLHALHHLGIPAQGEGGQIISDHPAVGQILAMLDCSAKTHGFDLLVHCSRNRHRSRTCKMLRRTTKRFLASSRSPSCTSL